ncbi:MAG: protein-ADP-ribose hydrolase [Bacteroidales bacterium]|nr:protein-ADP-ribose hydrolase [Bacteroidales bacterium]
MDRLENLDFCIRYLMRQNGIDADVPTTLKDRQLLLRALMNVWQPQPLSEEFLWAQDAELQAQLQDKGIVTLEEGTTPGNTLLLYQGDITCLRVDAIVNAANSMGLGCWHPLHKCIDNAIHSAAGLQLRQECHRLLAGSEIATGEAIITPAYNLPARYVVHTVGPIIPDGLPTYEQEEQLANCYLNSLRLAEANGCHSIAFCCISTGEFHFPNRRAAEIAVATVRQYEFKDKRFTVVFNVFKDIDHDIYRQLLGAH